MFDNKVTSSSNNRYFLLSWIFFAVQLILVFSVFDVHVRFDRHAKTS